MRILVVTGGTIHPDIASDFLRHKQFDKVICADAGLAIMERMRALGIDRRPDIIVGDFDSASSGLVDYYTGFEDVVIKRYSPEKDVTDTCIAMKEAMALCGPGDEIIMIGATGTRMDHTLANIFLMREPFEKGIRTYILDPYNKIYLLSGRKEFEKKRMYGSFLSLIALTDSMTIDIEGFEYDVKDKVVKREEGLCLSNLLDGKEGAIDVKDGIAIVFEVKD